jgi:hypothetical protein
LSSTRSSSSLLEADHLKAPALEALQYENRIVDGLIQSNAFASPPNQESNAAWHELLQGIFPFCIRSLVTVEFLTRLGTIVKVSGEDLSRVGVTSLALKDGSGFLATLGVYHELHCLVSFSGITSLIQDLALIQAETIAYVVLPGPLL